ncbi:MAG: DUF1203 domain-containing protein [Trueperaceae bacterium]|nr:MAG: DUF1203 domain-containing protein [Trueperaceae bacterium]
MDHVPLTPLFELTDEQLRTRHAVRRIANASTGYPCRVSLEDAREGEELLLLPHAHHPVDSPYRASGQIYVRRGVQQRTLAPGEVPAYVTRRLISVRAYDAGHMMVAASVCDGPEVGDEIVARFADPDAAYVHLHNAKQGCFSCLVVRA